MLRQCDKGPDFCSKLDLLMNCAQCVEFYFTQSQVICYLVPKKLLSSAHTRLKTPYTTNALRALGAPGLEISTPDLRGIQGYQYPNIKFTSFIFQYAVIYSSRAVSFVAPLQQCLALLKLAEVCLCRFIARLLDRGSWRVR